MTLSGRLTLLIVSLGFLALLGSLGVYAVTVRDALRSQHGANHRDAAAATALALGHHVDDLAAFKSAAAAQFEIGHYRRLTLRAMDGETLVDLQQPPQPQGRPDWLLAVLPIDVEAGRALISVDGRMFGTLETESRPEAAQQALWDTLLRTAAALAVMVLAATLLAYAALRSWLQPLDHAVAQAQALAQGRFAEAPEPRLAEWRGLTRSMNALVRRMRDVFAAQAEQVALLQRQAQQDSVTALPLRAPFLAQLQQRLAEPGGPGVGLILLRMLHLEAINARLGHEGTDQILRAVADVLLTYVDRVPGTFAGRLNGTDFALCLPVPGVASETATSLRTTLSTSPALRSTGAEAAVGAADRLCDLNPGAALAQADAALAFAEASADAVSGWPTGPAAPVGPTDAPHVGQSADPAGARAWRAQIAAALAEERTRIAEFRVVDRDGRLIHLECPLRVQLHPGGDYQTAARWLALAHRSRLLPQVDLAALGLALKATASDGQARSVHVALASLADPTFIAEVVRRLRAVPVAASKLSIECVEGLRPGEFTPLAEAAAAWRPLGVKLGVEHAGATPQQLPGLHSVGIDYVKVDARHVRGAAVDARVRGYAQSLVALIHDLSMSVLAEGVDDAADLAAVWAMGFDGATGPAVV